MYVYGVIGENRALCADKDSIYDVDIHFTLMPMEEIEKKTIRPYRKNVEKTDVKKSGKRLMPVRKLAVERNHNAYEGNGV